ncbi:phage major tail protein, TP901-1 family [Wenxinia saemankumensis]|uniref:Phage major tail protein, TP901-1 family n=1 Tax=Wenxinia saemankumensis TaxID=1447782 RepID=A0A1M6F072_9RHOB|nr:phage major tail protein, TP901-1 family [Wenxinia saemankumensis]SHI91029.1 phage major tail protein, TP901-1 family [Wenxinia saemankumensis]
MAKQKGRQLLIKKAVAATPTNFATVCGMTSKTISFNNNQIDVTTPDCETPGGPLWRELSEGIKSISVSGNGLFEGTASEKEMLALATADTPQAPFQIIVPGLGTFEGPFLLSAMEYGGEMEGSVTYTLTLESAGEITFTPAPNPAP